MYEEYTHTTEANLQTRAEARAELRREEFAALTNQHGELISLAQVNRKIARVAARIVTREGRYRNDALYAYIEIPVALFDTVLTNASELPWRRIQKTVDGVPVFDENDEPDMRRKTWGEYFLFRTDSIDKTKAIILVGGAEAPTYRMRGVTKQELAKLHTHLDTFGYGNTTWMSIDEAKTLTQTEEYKPEVT